MWGAMSGLSIIYLQRQIKFTLTGRKFSSTAKFSCIHWFFRTTATIIGQDSAIQFIPLRSSAQPLLSGRTFTSND